MPSLIGTKVNQVPTVGDLGTLAFQDSNAVNLTGGTAVIDNLTADAINLKVDTDISNIAPSLNLDFANSKTLDPRITYTRASTATYYDGVTTAKAEENLFLQSVDMANAAYSVLRAGVAATPTKTSNYGVAPDGTSTAARYQLSLSGGTAVGDFVGFIQGYNFGSAVTATYSVWIKSTDGVSTYNAQIIAPTALGSAVAITGTWQRFTVTATSITTNVGYGIRIRGGHTPTNSDTADILVWGAQLEQRSAVSSYTPTTTQAITNYIPVLQTAASGVARFEHNPTTGESLGLLIEEARTNLFTYSEQFDNAAWVKSNCTITSNQVIAPDGTLTGDRAVFTSGGLLYKNLIPNSAGTYTITAWVKSANGANQNMRMFGNGATTYSSNIAVTTEWQRLSFTFTYSSATSGFGTASGSALDIYIWGAQLEAGAFATSYIPTVASQVTRAADAASMTGTNFSSWYNQQEGTMYAEYVPSEAGTGAEGVFQIDDTTANNRHIIYLNTNQRVGFLTLVNSSITSTCTSINNSVTLYQSNKCAGSYAVNNFACSSNGQEIITDSDGVLPLNLTRAALGGATGSSNYLNGTIKKLQYFPKRLTNAELVEMTS